MGVLIFGSGKYSNITLIPTQVGMDMLQAAVDADKSALSQSKSNLSHLELFGRPNNRMG